MTLISAEGNGHTDLGHPTIDDTSPDYPGGTEKVRTIDNSCISMPTEADGVIGVTSVGPSGRKAYYSDYGVEQADVAAPGGDGYDPDATARPGNLILAAYPEGVGRTYIRPGATVPDIDANGNPTTPSVVKDGIGYYQWIQGTSMASPHAVGVAALIVARYGHGDKVHGGLTLDAADTERILLGTATDTPCPAQNPFVYNAPIPADYTATCEGTPSRNGFFGDGIVNALNAVKKGNRR